MSLRINDLAPDFTADTTHGQINFHQWLGQQWGVLFSHPKDFTPVCTSELGHLAQIHDEFTKRNTKVIGLSIDSIDDHQQWINDIEGIYKTTLNYPIIADTDLYIAKRYNMLPADIQGSAETSTPMSNATVRCVFIIAPDKSIKATMTYPMTTGRNFNEILRLIDAIQLSSQHKVGTPANWQASDDVFILPSITNKEAETLFPHGWRTLKPYFRLVKDPKN